MQIGQLYLKSFEITPKFSSASYAYVDLSLFLLLVTSRSNIIITITTSIAIFNGVVDIIATAFKANYVLWCFLQV